MLCIRRKIHCSTCIVHRDELKNVLKEFDQCCGNGSPYSMTIHGIEFVSIHFECTVEENRFDELLERLRSMHFNISITY